MRKSRKYIFNAVLLAAVTVAMRAIGVSFNAFVTRKAGAGAVGLFTLVGSVYSLAVTLGLSGVNLAAVRLTSRRLALCEAQGMNGSDTRRALKREMGGCIVYALFFGTLAGLLLHALAYPVGTYILGDARTVSSLRLSSFAIPAVSLTSALAGYFTGLRKVYKNALISVSEQLISIFAVSAALELIGMRGAEYACLSVIGGAAVAEIGSFLLSLLLYLGDRVKSSKNAVKTAAEGAGGGKSAGDAKSMKTAGRTRTAAGALRAKETKGVCKAAGGAKGVGKKAKARSIFSGADRGALRRAAAVAFPVAVGSYVRQGLLCAEHIAIPAGLRRFGGNAEAAFASYGVLHGMAFPLIFFPSSVVIAAASLLIPELEETQALGNREGAARIAGRCVRLTLIFAVGAAGVFLAFGGELGLSIYSSAEAGTYVAAFAPLIPIMYLDTAVDCVLKGMGQQVYCMKVNIIDAFLSLVLVLCVLPLFGIKGYVACVYITETVNFILSITRMVSVTNVTLRARDALVPLISSLCACTAVRLAASFLCRGLVAFEIGTSVLLYSAFVLLFSAFLRTKSAKTEKKQNSLAKGRRTVYNSSVWKISVGYRDGNTVK
ncbi:MAG: polysaccharide biosynthesis C-terminal domain-containing protein [Candidatus Avispirillum sp.]